MHKLITLLLVAVAMLGGYTWAGFCGDGIPGDVNIINGDDVLEQCDNGIYNGTNVAQVYITWPQTCTTSCQLCAPLAGGTLSIAAGASCVEVDDNGNEINTAYIASGLPMTSASFVPWLWASNSPYPVLARVIYNGGCPSGQIKFRDYKLFDDVIGFQKYQESCGPPISSIVGPSSNTYRQCNNSTWSNAGSPTNIYASTSQSCGAATSLASAYGQGAWVCAASQPNSTS